MPGYQINSESKLDALEIEDDLVDAIGAAGPVGLNFMEGSEIVGMDYDHFYRAAHMLAWMGRVKVERAQTGNQYRLILPHWDAPTLMLAEKQKQVFNLLCSEANQAGLVQISFAKIQRLTRCRAAAFAIDRLDYKGCLEIVDRGDSHRARTYRIYPNQDGPRGYSSCWWQ